MSRMPSVARTLLASAVLLSGCASAPQRTYVAPTNQTVVSTTEVSQGDAAYHLVYIDNRSTVPVTVFGMRLTGCENVKIQCGARVSSLHIGAGARQLALRIEPANRAQGFTYAFGFSWHPDSSSTAALAALAEGGSEAARTRLAAMQHADSLERAETGVHYNELSREDFAAIAPRAAALRADPDSLLLVPGEQTTVDRIHLLVVDAQGVVLGRTHWMGFRAPAAGAVQFTPPNILRAQAPGRTIVHFSLAEAAQRLLPHPLNDVDYPVVSSFPPDPHAPTFAGVAVDGDSKTPLSCARVALEDSAQNVMATARTSRTGEFLLLAPRPGTYRVRVESYGWAPVYGPDELAAADEMKQHQYSVRFVDQMIERRSMNPDEPQHAYPTAVRTASLGATRGSRAVVPAVTLGGSPSLPILGIVSRARPGTVWVQFVVDSTGAVDPAAVQYPAGLEPAAIASVKAMLPRVRFAPAREGGRPTCELLRLQVSFSAH
jgi:hypothetical protein